MSNEKILLVDDDPSLLRVTQFQLEQEGYAILTAPTGEDGLNQYKEQKPDMVITDLKMPGMDGMQLLQEIKRLDPGALVIVITAHGSVDTAISAMKKGAYDYITKPFEKDELLITTQKALEYQNLLQENYHLHEELLQQYSFENIVGGSEAMEKVFTIIKRVSRVESSVLIQGESGTGKELIARAIHYNSPRHNKQFVAVNCAAIPEHLMESEFFGHKKGAFTGAINDRAGKFELADGGSIFLDEIADMRLDLQSKLLRVLQEHEIDKVGSKAPIKIDVRVIAATNKDLKKTVDEGKFREDLYYRLSVLPIHLPPLRERTEDIPLLVRHFLKNLGGINLQVDPGVFEILKSHPFPGNARELHNVVEQAFVLRKEEDLIQVDDLPDYIKHQKQEFSPLNLTIPSEGINLEEIEKNLISNALKKAKGNQNKAAQLLGITRQTLIYRMKKFDLQ